MSVHWKCLGMALLTTEPDKKASLTCRLSAPRSASHSNTTKGLNLFSSIAIFAEGHGWSLTQLWSGLHQVEPLSVHVPRKPPVQCQLVFRRQPSGHFRHLGFGEGLERACGGHVLLDEIQRRHSHYR